MQAKDIPQDWFLFRAISGSHAYGTNNENSDVDERGIFVLPEDYIFGTKYFEQSSDEKNDITFFELKRFLELLEKNNANILEILNIPSDCVLYKHPAFDYILENKDKFLTKICADSFGKYATGQIRKAAGMDKMQNLEKEKVTRKSPIDFCYVVDGPKSYSIKSFLKRNKLEQKFCGISAIANARDMYCLYYDSNSHGCFSESISEDIREQNKQYLKEQGLPMGFGYKGFEKEDEDNSPNSNSLRLSSIPVSESNSYIVNFSYNKDGYTTHCKKYNQYQKWLNDRNTNRWVDVENHGQKIGDNKIDGKNLMHCKRLLLMASEIAEGKGVIVRRPDAKELLKIRQGKVSLENLIEWSENEIKLLDEKFKNSNLPDSVDSELIDSLLIKIRKEFYKK